MHSFKMMHAKGLKIKHHWSEGQVLNFKRNAGSQIPSVQEKFQAPTQNHKDPQSTKTNTLLQSWQHTAWVDPSVNPWCQSARVLSHTNPHTRRDAAKVICTPRHKGRHRENRHDKTFFVFLYRVHGHGEIMTNQAAGFLLQAAWKIL